MNERKTIYCCHKWTGQTGKDRLWTEKVLNGCTFNAIKWVPRFKGERWFKISTDIKAFSRWGARARRCTVWFFFFVFFFKLVHQIWDWSWENHLTVGLCRSSQPDGRGLTQRLCWLVGGYVSCRPAPPAPSPVLWSLINYHQRRLRQMILLSLVDTLANCACVCAYACAQQKESLIQRL